MRLSALLLVVVALATTVAHVSGATAKQRRDPVSVISLKKRPHVFVPGGSVPAVRDRKSVGRMIPMNGGVLTLGAYFTNVTVGSRNGQLVFDAIVDTGSSNTAVPSVGCANCGTTQLYNASLSSTAVPLYCGDAMCQNCAPTQVGSNSVPPNANASHCPYGGAECDDVTRQCGFSISYGGSSSALSGTTVQDVACLGGTICARAYVNQITGEFPTATQPTGIVGFAYPANACNPTCQPTILDSLVSGGALAPEQNTFGMCLDPVNGGVIDLGGVNASRFFGPMLYTPIVSQQWFNIDVRDIEVGGVSIGVPKFLYSIRNDALGSFVDSGTSIVIVSPYAFSVLQGIFTTEYSLPMASELFGGQCVTFANAQDAISQYPKIGFVLAGVDGQPNFTVYMTGFEYIMPTSVPVTANTTYCLGLSGVPSIGVILGDIIMQRYYIEFNRFENTLGFAPIASCV